MSSQQITKAVAALKLGEVIAYPTEAVYSLGCDPFNPQAAKKLFHVKQRAVKQGVILVAASVEQILPYVDLVGTAWEQSVLDSWPGPVTWVLPLHSNILQGKSELKMPEWITGGRETVAIRVSAHPTVNALCKAYGQPIVSTSANITKHPPALSCQKIKQIFVDLAFCIEGDLGVLDKPTQIKEAITGNILRN